MNKRSNGKNQQWKIIYIDSISKKELKDQQSGVVDGFGFHANRPFYIRSRLPMQRVAESIGASNVALKRWRKNVAAQQWFFDPVMKVIRSNYWKNYVMEIQSNGGSSNLRCTSTINGRWW